MGICASCLGKRRYDSYDEDDVSRPLFDDYGTFGDHNLNPQDPLETQREAEALQRVIARTSNNLVDVFEIAPPESQRTQATIFSGQDTRLARYQNILSNLSSEGDVVSTNNNAGTVEWLLSEEDNLELQGKAPSIKDEAGGPLVGTFADAVAPGA